VYGVGLLVCRTIPYIPKNYYVVNTISQCVLESGIFKRGCADNMAK